MDQDLSRESLIEMLTKLLVHRNMRKVNQDPPIIFAEKLLPKLDELKIFVEETKTGLNNIDEDIKNMEDKLKNLENSSVEDEEAIYQSQILIAETESLLDSNRNQSPSSIVEWRANFESFFSYLKRIFEKDYMELKETLNSPLINVNPTLELPKPKVRSDKVEIPSTGAELITKAKKSGKLLKVAKSSNIIIIK